MIVTVLLFNIRVIMNNLLGLDGGPSKCARFYMDWMDCSQTVGRYDHVWKCKNEKEDYLECLHNRKHVSLLA